MSTNNLTHREKYSSEKNGTESQQTHNKKHSTLPKPIKGVIGVLGIWICYLVYSLFQERVSTIPYGEDKEYFVYSAFLVFAQCVINGIFALLVIKFITRDPPFKGSVKEFAVLSFTYVSAMFCSNSSLSWGVNYPTQVLAKSSKPIPVMIGGFISGKRYGFRKVLNVFFICLGIALFLFKSKKKATESESESDLEDQHIVGYIFLICSLIFDGFTGSIQDKFYNDDSKARPTSMQMMLYINCWATLYMFIALIFTGEMYTSILFCIKYPWVIQEILLYSLCSACGQVFIYFFLQEFGALMLSITTTTRKFFTIFLSVILFGHQLSERQWLGVLFVFVGLTSDYLVLFLGWIVRPFFIDA